MYFLVQGLVNGDYDVVMGDLTIDSERLDLIDFSIPIQMADLVIMKKQSSTLDADMFAIAQPFSLHVWIAILGSGLLVTMSLTFAMRFGHERCSNPTLYSLWFTIGSMFGQGVEQLPS